MAKELPYFRFTVAEWLQGDISLETLNLKGTFIDVCAYYWFKDCYVSEQMLNKRFPNAQQEIEMLKELNIIKEKDNGNSIKISFLDEQHKLLSDISDERSKAGKASALKRATIVKQKLQQKGNYKDKNKDNKKNKNKYRDTVYLTKDEYQKLKDLHGEKNTIVLIDLLDYYKGSKGKTYKSDYKAILSWVVDKAKKEQKYIPQPIKSTTERQTGGKIDTMPPEVKDMAGELAEKFKV